jgi:hypothetical protein
MDNIINSIIDYIQERIYPLTFTHILYLAIITWLSSHITRYFLNYRLVKWIYIGTILVLIANLYNQGSKGEATKDIFKLATI